MNALIDWATFSFQADCGCTHTSSDISVELVLFDLQDLENPSAQKSRTQLETAQKTVGLTEKHFHWYWVVES